VYCSTRISKPVELIEGEIAVTFGDTPLVGHPDADEPVPFPILTRAGFEEARQVYGLFLAAQGVQFGLHLSCGSVFSSADSAAAHLKTSSFRNAR
jgi:hypothetical protein